MILIIVRHGELKGNVKVVISPKEMKLTKKGIEQARKIAKELKPFQINILIANDLIRAIQTAELIAKQLGITKVQITRQLRKYDMGILKRLPKEEAIQKYQQIVKRKREKGYKTFQGRKLMRPSKKGDKIFKQSNREK